MKTSLVVTVFEGRNFVREDNCKLYLNCRFNDEILSTDPVDSCSDPIWDTELEWKIDEKSLKLLKSQREMMKLQCFKLNLSHNTRESIGYLMLDPRQALPYPGKDKWSLPYRPEVRLNFVLESGDEFNAPSVVSISPKRIQHRPISRTLFSPQNDQNHSATVQLTAIPVRFNEGGFHEIGQAESFFLIHTTIQPVSLEHDEEKIDSKAIEYYFYYSFLGSTIVTETFQHVGNPYRQSFRVKSSPGSLADFIKQLETVTVFLCSGTGICGHCQVKMDGFENSSFDSTVYIDSQLVKCKLHFSIRIEEEIMEIPEAELVIPSVKQSVLNVSQTLPPSSTPLRVYSPTKITSPMTPKGPLQLNFVKYRLSLDFRSILDISQELYGVYLKCTYHGALSEPKVLTSYPPIHAYPRRENILPPSLFVFEFEIQQVQLASYLENSQIVTEVWHSFRDETGKLCEKMHGQQKKPLIALLLSNEKLIPCRTESTIDIFNENATLLGRVNIIASIEDCLDFNHAIKTPNQTIKKSDDVVSPSKISETSSNSDLLIRGTQEYEAAKQLEIWKENELEQFKKSLAEKESVILKEFMDGFRKQTDEQRSLLMTKLAEIETLENRSSAVLKQIESREKGIAQAEISLGHRETELNQEHKKLLAYAKDTTRRLNDDFEHSKETELLKISDLDTSLSRAKEERKELMDKCKKLELEHQQLKFQQGISSSASEEVELKTKLEEVSRQKKNLEESVKELETAKSFYKDACSKAMKELIVLKKKAEAFRSGSEPSQTSLELTSSLESNHQPISNQESRNLNETFPTEEDVEKSVERLRRERDILIKTGIYQRDDLFIKALEDREKTLRRSRLAATR